MRFRSGKFAIDGPKPGANGLDIPLSLLGCFLAIEVGVFIFIAGLVLFVDPGPMWVVRILVETWLFMQAYLLPMMIAILPLGLIARVILDQLFSRPLPVALSAGGLVGGLTTVAIIRNIEPESLIIHALGALSGLIGGYVWWLVERKHLERAARARTSE